MRFLFISDLHIKQNTRPEDTNWVAHFCRYIAENAGMDPVIVFVLGDVIDQGIPAAFNAADEFFSYIKAQVSPIDIQFIFLPGNHDYCDTDLSPFLAFCQKHQSRIVKHVNFTEKNTWQIEFGQMNFILADSMGPREHGEPGLLDVTEIGSAFIAGKNNVLLMHHRLLFEDTSSSAGVVNQYDVLAMLKRLGIHFVLQGHAHFSKEYDLSDDIHVFGVGSMGKDAEEMGEWVENEYDQFVVMSVDGNRVESIDNMLFRGGEKRFASQLLYPRTHDEYSDGSGIPLIEYQSVEGYIARTVMKREEAQDPIARCFNDNSESSLYSVCLREKYTLLIADAALGKSVELQNLAYTLTARGGGVRPVLLQLRDYSGTSIEDFLIRKHPEYATLNPRRFVLILDGYDELSSDNASAFKRELKHYITTNPDTLICTSMRSNFYTKAVEVFSDFSVYQLMELGHKTIDGELHKHGVDITRFREECRKNNLIPLLGSPFYLKELILIYVEKHTLPASSQLMADIIDRHINQDCRKFEFAVNVEERTVEMETALTKLAFGMQLLETAQLTERQYQQLLKIEERNLLKFSSLTVSPSPREHEFLHNIFKEYLTAKYLSRQPLDAIASYVYIEQAGKINASWFNVLGFVMQMRPDEELIQWIYRVDPLAITRFEKDRITEGMRYEILELALGTVERANVWLGSSLCDPARLAEFSQSSKALDRLLKGIQEPPHFRALSACLSVLAFFDTLYGKNKEVRTTLIQCYRNEKTRPYEKRYAIEAIAKLNLQTEEFTTELVESFCSGATSEERLGIYQYISESGQTNEKIEFLLTALMQITERQVDEERFTSESIQLLSCLKKVSSAPAVCEVIKWFACSEKTSARSVSVFQDEVCRIINKAALLYKAGHHEIFDVVLLFLDDTFDFSMIPYKGAILAFFKETNTQNTMIKKLSVTEIEQRSYLIRLLCETDASLIPTINKLYEHGEINDKFYKEFVEKLPVGDEFNRCAEIYHLKTGETIAPPVERIDYATRDRDGCQRFWDSLFDEAVADELLAELLTFYGKEITIGKLTVRSLRYSEYTPGLIQFIFSLKRSKMEGVKAADFFTIAGRDNYFITEIIHYLQTDRDNRSIQIRDDQKDKLLELYWRLESSLNISTQYKEDTIDRDLFLYLLLKKTFSWTSAKHVAVDLVEIPAYLFVEWGEKEKEEKYNILEAEIGKQTIIEKVVQSIDRHTSKYIMEDLFYGCKRYGIVQGKEAALRFCAREDIDYYDKRVAVEYLATVFGTGVILDTLLATADNKLFRVCLDYLHDVDNDYIHQQLVDRYHSSGDKHLLREMLNRNMPEGVECYIAESTKDNHPVHDDELGFHELTDAIGQLKDPALLPLLKKVTEMLFQPTFQDAKFGSLYNSLVKAFCNCAENCYDAVTEVIHTLKEKNNGNLAMVNFCNTTIGVLEANYAEKVKKVWSISEVAIAIAQIEAMDL